MRTWAESPARGKRVREALIRVRSGGPLAGLGAVFLRLPRTLGCSGEGLLRMLWGTTVPMFPCHWLGAPPGRPLPSPWSMQVPW